MQVIVVLALLADGTCMRTALELHKRMSPAEALADLWPSLATRVRGIRARVGG